MRRKISIFFSFKKKRVGPRQGVAQGRVPSSVSILVYCSQLDEIKKGKVGVVQGRVLSLVSILVLLLAIRWDKKGESLGAIRLFPAMHNALEAIIFLTHKCQKRTKTSLVKRYVNKIVNFTETEESRMKLCQRHIVLIIFIYFPGMSEQLFRF